MIGLGFVVMERGGDGKFGIMGRGAGAVLMKGKRTKRWWRTGKCSRAGELMVVVSC